MLKRAQSFSETWLIAEQESLVGELGARLPAAVAAFTSYACIIPCYALAFIFNVPA